MKAFWPRLGALGSFLAFFSLWSLSPPSLLRLPPLDAPGFSASYRAFSALYFSASLRASSSYGFFSASDRAFHFFEMTALISVKPMPWFSDLTSSLLASQKSSQADLDFLGALGSFFTRFAFSFLAPPSPSLSSSLPSFLTLGDLGFEGFFSLAGFSFFSFFSFFTLGASSSLPLPLPLPLSSLSSSSEDDDDSSPEPWKLSSSDSSSASACRRFLICLSSSLSLPLCSSSAS
mmetsp:Transcript_85407/g.227738  ORF Transcript_85407/g.227738 Transcript_85407/m.227738 type:complete len:233 (+) Transcript_85407:384-1082(+)